MMRSRWSLLAVGLVTLWAGMASAQDTAVTQAVGHGKIDYSNKTVTTTGSGAPNLKAANVAVARLGAERAAKMDALRNILEAVKGVRISSNKTAGAAMEETPALSAKVEGIVKNFKILDTKYYSDGGVDVIVQVPLDGVLLEAMVVQAGTNPAKATAGEAVGGVTGIVINAKGLGVLPALAPRLLDEAGKEVYGAARINKDALNRHGVAGYTTSMEAAMKDARVADKPMVIKPLRINEANGSDLVLGAEDVQKLAKLASLIGDAKVVIITD